MNAHSVSAGELAYKYTSRLGQPNLLDYNTTKIGSRRAVETDGYAVVEYAGSNDANHAFLIRLHLGIGELPRVPSFLGPSVRAPL